MQSACPSKNSVRQVVDLAWRIKQGSRHTDGCGQSVVGRPENSRGTSPVGVRRLRAHRLSAHTEAAPPAVSDLADVPRQPCLRSGLPRFLHGAHRAPARPLCSCRARSPPPARRPLQRDRASHRPLDRPADRGCLSGRLRALLSPARPRPALRRTVSAPSEGHADPGSPHGPAQPVAEPLRGAAHRLDPARVSESRSGSRRKPPAPHSDPLLLLLSPGSHASRARQGCAGPANVTEIIINIYPPPVASSPLDRGWHIALTRLRASAIRDYLDVRSMNGCPAKAVGSIAGDADKALVGQAEIVRGRGRATPAHGIPSRLL